MQHTKLNLQTDSKIKVMAAKDRVENANDNIRFAEIYLKSASTLLSETEKGG